MKKIFCSFGKLGIFPKKKGGKSLFPSLHCTGFRENNLKKINSEDLLLMEWTLV